MFELKLKMDLSLSPCLYMIHVEPVSACFFLTRGDKCEQVLEDRFDGLLLIDVFSLQRKIYIPSESINAFWASFFLSSVLFLIIKNAIIS